ncbi:cell division protein ZapE [Biformimicrobium ophioploci]|uniref:Cell division protein ZapE n=1 Tax=Biformimicrobium ophioploci TaxID=3036711 RepID=A0ABQ6LX37_9GAMM|nr:cell division protein ZapE [Microbulbifer sp. NKW57]GMG86615.1 cell division protein ZapE [Microbulbifer sp. NKW57]
MSEQSPLTPLQRYEHDLTRPGFRADPAQRAAVEALEDLYHRLLRHRAARQSLVGRFKSRFGTTEVVQGLYFWGGVGRGKTYLMDSFFESLPFEQKMRAHFHRFMREVHADLKRLAGQKNPLEQVADGIAARAQVLCFDEFFVSDITDAMILAGLMDGLFRRGVTLVATSNIVPDGLYKDGLQRARFLPAIDLLNRYTQVINVDGGVDYRLRALEQAELYHAPLDAAANESLQASFDSLIVGGSEVHEDIALDIEGRSITAYREADDVAWFEFEALCDGPRSQNDYIELAREYHAVLVGNVPQFDSSREDQARRFINLVDEFYDRSVKLVLSAAVPLEQLYAGQRLIFEFERTVSRLLEMQSHEYLARPHKP